MKMFVKYIIFALCVANIICKKDTIRYDSFHGHPITDEEYKEHVKKNTTFWCLNEIEPCRREEGRRVDGSCNNLKSPSRGAAHTPVYRILPADCETDEPNKADWKEPLPPPRYLRTSLLASGVVPDQRFTQLVTHFLVFFTGDFVSIQDTVNYIAWKPYCCDAKGQSDPVCVPMKIRDDDPVFRFSDIRCLNLTKPISFQTEGCIKKEGPLERIMSATPSYDLSPIYGNDAENLRRRYRIRKNGMLKYEVEDGRVWPPSVKGKIDFCFLNQKPVEKRCHDTPETGTNAILGGNLFSIWYWRYHNFIAKSLSEINPCWSDDKLFETARDINIAAYSQMLYYELLPELMGKENLIKDKVLSRSHGHRDVYNEEVPPQTALEFPFGLRWFHTMQEGTLKMYDENGYYLKSFPVVNLTLRTGYLAVDDHLDHITQGSFRQPSAKNDYVVDPDVSNIGLGPHQRASDLLSSDLSKNRHFDFQPYVKYRQFCFGKTYHKFKDLADVFDPERLELLEMRYKSVEDIDLISGIWLEKHIQHGHIPETLYCLMAEQLARNVVSDRHWYERKERPNAFTSEQLREIRKSTMASLLCDVGDTVTEIQENAFLRDCKGNEIRECDDIKRINFNAWKDPYCFESSHHRQ